MTKSYADLAVLRGIDLTVPAGTVCVPLGPNGAAKTTMVRILSTLTTTRRGDARVRRVRRPPGARWRTPIDRCHGAVLRDR
ncbi:MAG: ATP-binding cassette domain-containing protein [Nocardioides sp.]